MVADNTPEPINREHGALGSPARRLLASARRAANAGDLDAALAGCEQALAADPDLQEAWLALAALTPDMAFAGALYERILQKWPECAEAREGLASSTAGPGAMRSAAASDASDAGGLAAAARAGAPIYRGSNRRGSGSQQNAHAAGQDDSQTVAHTPLARPHSRSPFRRAGPWLGLLFALAFVALTASAVLLSLPRNGNGAAPALEAPPALMAPVQESPPVPASERDVAAWLHPVARRHLVFLPSQRWIEIDLANGHLTAFEGRDPVGAMPVGGPRLLSHAVAAGSGAAAWRARLVTSSAYEPGQAILYTVDMAPDDARWLAAWLGPHGGHSGQFLLAPGRILISLDPLGHGARCPIAPDKQALP